MELPEDIKRGDRTVTSINELMKPAKGVAPVFTEQEIIDEDEGGEKGKGSKTTRPGSVVGRSDRHKARAERTKLRKGRENEGTTGRALLNVDLDDRPSRTKERLKKKQQQRGSL